jgi:hypothetical protein
LLQILHISVFRRRSVEQLEFLSRSNHAGRILAPRSKKEGGSYCSIHGLTEFDFENPPFFSFHVGIAVPQLAVSSKPGSRYFREILIIQERPGGIKEQRQIADGPRQIDPPRTRSGGILVRESAGVEETLLVIKGHRVESRSHDPDYPIKRTPQSIHSYPRYGNIFFTARLFTHPSGELPADC